MKHETYQHARIRLLGALAKAGWMVKPSLKVPQAIHPVHGFTLYFKPQAVYLNQHSLWIDIRGMSLTELLEACNGRHTYDQPVPYKCT